MAKVDIKALVEQVQKSDNKNQALINIMNTFSKYILNNSIIDGKIDEDCMQELNITLINCVQDFKHDEDKNVLDYLKNDNNFGK